MDTLEYVETPLPAHGDPGFAWETILDKFNKVMPR